MGKEKQDLRAQSLKLKSNPASILDSYAALKAWTNATDITVQNNADMEVCTVYKCILFSITIQ